MSRPRVAFFLLTSTALVFLHGCQRPLRDDDASASLHRGLVESVRRELAIIEDASPRSTTQPPGAVAERLAPRRDELDRMAGPLSYTDVRPVLGPDLVGREQQRVGLGLQQAINAAVKSNLDLELARLQPRIAEAEITRAEAAFDGVFFARADFAWLDEPQATPQLNDIPLGSNVNVRRDARFETGLRKRLGGGGQVMLSTELTRAKVKTPGFSFSPDPAWLARVSLGVEQPLLRDFGSDVNFAEIRLAHNADRAAVQELKRGLLEVAAETESAYWQLLAARWNLGIQQRLLERGQEVLDLLERRRIRDANEAQIADAIATVEQRRAQIIRAERAVRIASDRLKALMNDAELTIGSEVLLDPVDAFVESPMHYNLAESISTALEHRPEIFRALIAVDDAAIGVTVADNQRLPRLDLSARIEYLGLDSDFDGAYGNIIEDSFIDYFLGFFFEQPLGNRAGEADARRSRLRQSAAVIGYRRSVRDVVLDVKSALRDMVTNYELIEATRAFRLAQTENLRVLTAEIENKLGYTPESLNLLFQRQSTLAAAEIEEIQALANFNTAAANLARAMGTGLTRNGIDFAAEPDRR